MPPGHGGNREPHLIGSGGAAGPVLAVLTGAADGAAVGAAEAVASAVAVGAALSPAVPVAASGSVVSAGADGADPRGSLTTCWPFGSHAARQTATAASAVMWANTMEPP